MTMMESARMTAPVSLYLKDIQAPVVDEVTQENLAVIGEIPRDLNGISVRNSIVSCRVWHQFGSRSF
jgi:carotenoid cleavage dioxygenase-like enzyme